MTAEHDDPPDAATIAALQDKATRLLARNDFRSYIELIAPHIEYPAHLQPYIDVLLRTLVEPQKACLSAPPRHGKSETTALFLSWVLFRDPTRKICYGTYGEDLSVDMSLKVRNYFQSAGGRLSKEKYSVLNWETAEGGGLDTTSVNSGRTGRGYHIIIVDDPVRGRADAESAANRERVAQWFSGTMSTRTEGKALGGTSIVVMATRWHKEDLIGQLIRRGWQWVNIPALSDEGVPLWPRMFDKAYFDEFQLEHGEYEFYAQFMGVPRSKGAEVFSIESLRTYSELPSVARVTIGIDFAYSSKAYSDYSAVVVLYEADGIVYVADVWRDRVTPDAAKNQIRAMQEKHRGTVYACITATERGMIEFLKSNTNGDGVVQSLVELPANRFSGDKFSRAQPVAAAIRACRVAIPKARTDWLDSFVSELADFTGLGDNHDDQVDAMSAAFYPLQKASRQRFVQDETHFHFG